MTIKLNKQEQTGLQWSATVCICIDSLKLSAVELTVCNCLKLSWKSATVFKVCNSLESLQLSWLSAKILIGLVGDVLAIVFVFSSLWSLLWFFLLLFFSRLFFISCYWCYNPSTLTGRVSKSWRREDVRLEFFFENLCKIWTFKCKTGRKKFTPFNDFGSIWKHF